MYSSEDSPEFPDAKKSNNNNNNNNKTHLKNNTSIKILLNLFS